MGQYPSTHSNHLEVWCSSSLNGLGDLSDKPSAWRKGWGMHETTFSKVSNQTVFTWMIHMNHMNRNSSKCFYLSISMVPYVLVSFPGSSCNPWRITKPHRTDFQVFVVFFSHRTTPRRPSSATAGRYGSTGNAAMAMAICQWLKYLGWTGAPLFFGVCMVKTYVWT